MDPPAKKMKTSPPMLCDMPEDALGLKLVKWSMRHRLKKILTPFGKKKFTFDGLFPEEERNLDFVSGQPQVSFSLLSHQPPAQLRIVILTRSKYRFADAHRRLRGSQVRGSERIRGVAPWRHRHLLHVGRRAHGPPPTDPAVWSDLRGSR